MDIRGGVGISAVAPVLVEPAPATALERFRQSAGGSLKADALSVLDRKTPVLPDTDDEAAKLADARAECRRLLKTIEARRKDCVEPIKREAAVIDAEARLWREPLEAWDRAAELALLAYNRLREDRRQAALVASQAAQDEAIGQLRAAEDADDAAGLAMAQRALVRAELDAPREEIRGYRTEAGTNYERESFEIEVLDVALVPLEYLIVDVPRVKAAVRGGAREIPGISIVWATRLSVRTR